MCLHIPAFLTHGFTHHICSHVLVYGMKEHVLEWGVLFIEGLLWARHPTRHSSRCYFMQFNHHCKLVNKMSRFRGEKGQEIKFLKNTLVLVSSKLIYVYTYIYIFCVCISLYICVSMCVTLHIISWQPSLATIPFIRLFLIKKCFKRVVYIRGLHFFFSHYHLKTIPNVVIIFGSLSLFFTECLQFYLCI